MSLLATYLPLLSGMGALFETAYSIVRQHEGGYVNHPLDPGKETYAGISRRFWPNWSGWYFIDATKVNSTASEDENENGFFDSISDFFGFGSIETNTIFPSLESKVEAFYKNLWGKSKASQIVDQQVANNFFDFFILSSKAVEILQKSLNALGFRVTVDNQIGPQTLASVNRANPTQLNNELVKQRKIWHEQQVASGNAPGLFINNWKKRANNFQVKNNTQMIVGTVFVSLAFATGIYMYNAKKKK